MTNKLLSVKFKSLLGTHEFVLGANSPDNITPFTNRKRSDVDPLMQVGCMILGEDTRADSTSIYGQVALYNCFKKAGYGKGNGLCPDASSIGVKMYLNGKDVVDGVAQPYIQWVQGSYAPVLHYFKGDGTDLGVLATLSSHGGGACPAYLGQIYSDGTFTGQIANIYIHIIGGVYFSHKIYEWWMPPTSYTNRQLISTTIIDDINEYLPSEPEGNYTEEGTGDFDATSDPVDFPGLPGVSVLDTGLLKMFQMNTAQLQALADYLWSGLFDLDTFKKLFSDPMEAILNLSIMPIDEATSTTSSIRIGNITTSVTGLPVSNQYKIIDFGTINMNEFWASYADYSPYTRLSIFLPYVGVQAMSIDDVMNGSIHLKAYVDLLTGSVQYILKSNQTNRAGHGHNSVLYTWGGNCQYQIPLSATNMSQVISSIMSVTMAIAGGVATAVTAGAAAPATAAAATALKASTAMGVLGASTGAIGGVMSAKTQVQRGGGIGGAVGIFGVQTPYLILERPEQVYPENYEATKGAPTMQTKPLRYYSGYVRVEAVNLSIPGATEAELKDIEAKLKGGVIV